MKQLTAILASAALLSGCASTDLTDQQRQAIAECESSGGLYMMYTSIIMTKPERCLSAGELARHDELEMACVQSGGRPYAEGNKLLSNGAEVYGGCGSRQPKAPIAVTKSSVPDIEVQPIEPYKAPEKTSWNCRSTTTNGTTNTYCN